MSQNITQVLADNIKKFRLENKWSQDDLANKINIARPSISKWENAQSEPSSSQLHELSKVFNVSTDILMGSPSKQSQKVIIIDTSILIKKPIVIDELISFFDEVIIPDIVIREINYIKDKKPKRSENQKAWLAMVNIQRIIDSNNPKLKVVKSEYVLDSINDEKIANIAKSRAIQSINDQVYIYTDDVYFHFLIEKYANLHIVTPKNYDTLFPESDDSDPIIMQEFFAAIKLRNYDYIEKFDNKNININKHDSETGFTPLIQAVRYRDNKMIKTLINKYPNINLELKDKSRYIFTPLLNACQTKNLDSMRILIDAGADVNMGGSGKNHGNTPIMVCAWEGFYEGVKLLMDTDISYNQQDFNGYTALHKACIKHFYPIVKLLIEKTDLKIRDHQHRLALECIDPNNSNSKALYELFRIKGENNGRKEI